MALSSYSLSEVQKAVVALVIAGVAIAGYFVAFDPGFQDAAVLVTVGVFNVIGVFAAKNHTADDVSKAVLALAASSLGLVAFFVTVNPNDTQTILGIVAAVVNAFGVWFVPNSPSTA
jgi:hypothetical protein